MEIVTPLVPGMATIRFMEGDLKSMGLEGVHGRSGCSDEKVVSTGSKPN